MDLEVCVCAYVRMTGHTQVILLRTILGNEITHKEDPPD